MSQHSSDKSNLHYYEGDQSKLYSGIMNHHFGHDVKSETSNKQKGRIWKIFWILLVITIVEVMIGMFLSHSWPKALVVSLFLLLTLVKAGFIVSVFMHLGDEIRAFLITMMIPLSLFIWFIIAFLADGDFWLNINHSVPVR